MTPVLAQETKSETFSHWCGIELFGHARVAGLVTEQTIGGVALLRVDVPKPDAPDETLYTTYLGNGAIYRMTPTTKDEVLRIVKSLHPAPPTPRVLPPAVQSVEPDDDDFDDELDFEDSDDD